MVFLNFAISQPLSRLATPKKSRNPYKGGFGGIIRGLSVSNLPASGAALGFLETLIGSPILIIVTLLALLVAGAIIIFIVGTLLLFLPAFIVAGVVWWMTGSELLAGGAFLLVALVALAKK